MKVQINLSSPFEYTAGDVTPKFGFKGDILVAVDPGKTNMAMTVGTPDGTRLCILQFRAPGSGYDTSDYCHDFKDFLSHYLGGCNILTFGIESAISKRGMNHHHSSFVLTEIRANLIDLAYTLTGRRPLEINNWSWKHAILPDGYRSQSEKGSARYYSDVYKVYKNADVTDSLCMYDFIVQKYHGSYAIIPDAEESPLCDYDVKILPLGCARGKARKFVYSSNLSIEANATYFANRTWELGIAVVNIEDLSIEAFYRYAEGFKLPIAFNGYTPLNSIARGLKNVSQVEVVVVRRC